MSGLVRQVERRHWKALQKADWIIVDGERLLLRKRGVERLLEDVARVPLFGDVIELLLSPAMRATLAGKPTAEMLKVAFLQAAEDAGLDAGKELRNVVTALPTVFKALFVEDVILADEDERPDFAAWLGTLGLSGVLDAFVGWAGVNLPEVKDPLVRGAAWLLAEADKMLKGLAAGGVPLQPSSDTAAAQAAPAEATEPMAAAA